MSAASLSVVIPLYNEEARLSTTFAAVDAFARQHPFSDLEIIFVDDGSTDRTAELMRGFTTTCPVRCLSYKPNAGKGAAVRKGMMAATMEYALLLDADMSTPIQETERCIAAMSADAPVIIGTRKSSSSRVEKHQHGLREKLGEIFTLLARWITGVRVSDFTCGFKMFSREARQSIFPHSKIDRWSYDAEILFLATRRGFAITEVGVTWTNDERTRVRLWRDVFGSLRDLFRIRWMT